jgi:hypothetical protein
MMFFVQKYGVRQPGAAFSISSAPKNDPRNSNPSASALSSRFQARYNIFGLGSVPRWHKITF